jgi:hypothetical protein
MLHDFRYNSRLIFEWLKIEAKLVNIADLCLICLILAVLTSLVMAVSCID